MGNTTRPALFNEDGELLFDHNALADQCKKYHILQSHIMSIFGHTNPTLVKDWMNGKTNITIDALLRLCQQLNLDLLSFIKLGNHKFVTNLEDLYRLECAGINVRDILIEHGIVPYEDKNHIPAKRDRITLAERDTIKDDVQQRMSRYLFRESTTRVQQFTSNDMVNKLLEVQRECFEHEQKNMDELRARMQATISERDKQIAELRAELKLRQGYRMVADNNEVM